MSVSEIPLSPSLSLASQIGTPEIRNATTSCRQFWSHSRHEAAKDSFKTAISFDNFPKSRILHQVLVFQAHTQQNALSWPPRKQLEREVCKDAFAALCLDTRLLHVFWIHQGLSAVSSPSPRCRPRASWRLWLCHHQPALAGGIDG